MNPNELHQKALRASVNFQKAEVELLVILSQMDLQKAYLSLGYSSLFAYVVKGLKFSEAQACTLIQVSRKSREVPELKQEIENGSLSISKAKKVVSVITKENQKEWIEKAQSLTHRDLEKEVARLNPESITSREFIKTISENTYRFHMGISSDVLQSLKRSQMLLSQRKRKMLSLEETLKALSDFYLEKKDPLLKAGFKNSGANAQNLQGKSKEVSKKSLQTFTVNQLSICPEKSRTTSSMRRSVIPSFLKRQVMQRDQGRCSYISKNGTQCQSTSFVQIHHRRPLSRGGTHVLSNLQTLCAAHHQFHHRMERAS